MPRPNCHFCRRRCWHCDWSSMTCIQSSSFLTRCTLCHGRSSCCVLRVYMMRSRAKTYDQGIWRLNTSTWQWQVMRFSWYCAGMTQCPLSWSPRILITWWDLIYTKILPANRLLMTPCTQNYMKHHTVVMTNKLKQSGYLMSHSKYSLFAYSFCISWLASVLTMVSCCTSSCQHLYQVHM